MHYGNDGAQRYLETDLGSMTPEKMIVLLYERMIRDLRQAAEALAGGDRPRVTELVSHSQLIVGELRGALDHSVGGEVSRNLDNLYEWLFLEHLELLAAPAAERIDDCIRVIEPLLAAWRQIPSGTAAREARENNQALAAAAAGPNPAPAYGDPGAGAASEPAESTADRNRFSVTV